MINSGCNLSCPFCFADGIVNKGQLKVKEMTEDDFKFILNFLKEKTDTITLMGGEPTIHKYFFDFMKKTLNEGFNVMLLTNGTWNDKVLNFLMKLPQNRVTYCVNINKYMGNKNLKNVISNLLPLKDGNIILSVNIDKINFDFDFYKNIIKEISPKAVRWSYALPGDGNVFLEKAEYSILSQSLIDFFDFLLKNNIKIIPDHLVPLCMFDKDQIEFLKKNEVKIKTRCTPIIDILPDLSVINCFPLFGKIDSFKLQDFDSIDQIYDEFDRILKKKNKELADYRCGDCEISKKNICTGGCLALRMTK